MHNERCLPSEGDWVCAPSCTHDADEANENRKMLLVLATDQIHEMRQLLAACGVHCVNADTCAVCKLHFADCEKDTVAVLGGKGVDALGTSPIEGEEVPLTYACPGALARLYLRGDTRPTRAGTGPDPVWEALKNAPRSTRPLSPELRRARERAMKDFAAGRVIPGEFVSEFIQMRVEVEKLRESRADLWVRLAEARGVLRDYVAESIVFDRTAIDVHDLTTEEIDAARARLEAKHPVGGA